MKNYGCKNGFPHDLQKDFEEPEVIHEYCAICGKKFKWNKDKQGRIDNKEYIKAHVRNTCQAWGEHSQLYHILYRPEFYEANKHLWVLNLREEPQFAKSITRRDITQKGTNGSPQELEVYADDKAT